MSNTARGQVAPKSNEPAITAYFRKASTQVLHDCSCDMVAASGRRPIAKGAGSCCCQCSHATGRPSPFQCDHGDVRRRFRVDAEAASVDPRTCGSFDAPTSAQACCLGTTRFPVSSRSRQRPGLRPAHAAASLRRHRGCSRCRRRPTPTASALSTAASGPSPVAARRPSTTLVSPTLGNGGRQPIHLSSQPLVQAFIRYNAALLGAAAVWLTVVTVTVCFLSRLRESLCARPVQRRYRHGASA